MLLDVLSVAAGCGLLFLGGNWLVDGMAGLSRRLCIPPVIVAFAVAGFGTSAPELFVAVDALLAQAPDIAMGNIVGSNIANLLLVLALAALVSPISIDRDVLRFDGAGVLLAAFALWLCALDGQVSRAEAVFLVGGTVVYLALRWRSRCADAETERSPQFLRAAALAASALVALWLGADLCVEGGRGIAGALGVSQALIGLTVVAIGTSLPEIAVCLAAAMRREAGMILGSILGSNVFNSTVVLGGAALVSPVLVAETFILGWIPAMLCATVVALSLLRTDYLLSRKEAGVLLTLYLAFFLV